MRNKPDQLTIEQAAQLLEAGGFIDFKLYFSVITTAGKSESYCGDDDYPVDSSQSIINQIRQFVALAPEHRCSDFTLSVRYQDGTKKFQLINAQTLEPI